ncbi:MAG: hypothetical protein ACE5IK_07510 [Acidobacteriota bacterium]
MTDRQAAPERKAVQEHIEALSRLPYGALFFDITGALDFRLVEKNATDLADELALLEEGMAAAAERLGAEAARPHGIGKILAAEPGIRELLEELIGRILPVLGHPRPGTLAGRVPVAVDLHVTPGRAAGIGLMRRRVESSTN